MYMSDLYPQGHALHGMTQARWESLSARERDAIRDTSGLHACLIGYEGKRVRVEPTREFGASTFSVARSTGWRPCHLAMRSKTGEGSSDVINPREPFGRVTVLAR